MGQDPRPDQSRFNLLKKYFMTKRVGYDCPASVSIDDLKQMT
jgi:hypothetical protein